MARSIRSSGHSVRAVAPSGGVTVDVPVLIGAALFGVPLETAAEGATFELQTMAEAELPKDTSTFAVGALVYWDNTAKALTSTATSNRKVGVATQAAATGDAKVWINLLPQVA
jgi:predicted RecA/RadA family phage recombinase